VLMWSLIAVNTLSEWWEHSKAVELTNENFFDHIGKADKYYIVKFYTKWCFYCRKMSPEYEKVVDYYAGKRDDIVIARIECGDNDEIALQYEITSYPQVIMFKPNSKKIKSKFTKSRNLSNFVEWIEKYAPRTEITVIEPKTEIDKLVSMKDSSLKSPPPVIPTGTKIQNQVKDEKQAIMNDEVEFLKREFVYIRSKISSLEQEVRNLRGSNQEQVQKKTNIRKGFKEAQVN